MIQPDQLEELLISAAVKHLGLTDMVMSISEQDWQKSNDFEYIKDVMTEIYKQLDAMMRQLQVSL